MGLDMYLNSKYYVQNWDHTPKERQHKISVQTGGKKSNIPTDKISYIECQEIYWRKANHIHKWFVDNCQEGVDDCRSAYVSREQLQQLLDIVNQVLDSTTLVVGWITNGYRVKKGKDGKFKEVPYRVRGKRMKDPSVAKSLLPTQQGFFFGGSEYDEYYWEDLVHTKKELERILVVANNKDLPDSPDFYYHSSW